MHAEVVERLRANPSLLAGVLRRLEEWSCAGLLHPRYAAAWRKILERPLEDICSALTDPSEHHRALRQATPFVGILDSATRWRIWREVGKRQGER